MTANRIKLNILGITFTVRNPFAIKNNSVVLIKNGKTRKLNKVSGLNIKFYGPNNKIEFYDKIPKFKNVKIDCGTNTNIIFGASKYTIKNLYINARSENVNVNIGADFSIESGKFDFRGEPNLDITIGNDCQFGSNINIDPADGHTLFDNETKLPLNTPKSISIGDHVWLCENVSILKGTKISDNSIVGKSSLVTKEFNETNKVIAGVPARIVQSEKFNNINWSRTPNKYFV